MLRSLWHGCTHYRHARDTGRRKDAARNERHEQWLRSTIGDRRTYRWGKIWCGVDSKGGFASIAVTYNHWNIS